MAKRTCSIDGCDGCVVGRGWCDKHYRRWKRRGDPLAVLSRVPAVCSIIGCSNPVVARSWCSRHWQRWVRTGNPLGSTRKRLPELCCIKGCGGRAVARGWCGKHYQRWQKHGDPLYRKARPRSDPEARFWAKVSKDGPVPARRPELGPCWVWTAGTNRDGYGRFWSGEREVPAARYIWELKVGPIPGGHEPDHLCRNTGCVNYESHLEVVPGRENTLRNDGPSAVNARRTHCVNLHEFTPENTRITVKPNGRTRRTCKTCARERGRRWQAKRRAEREAA